MSTHLSSCKLELREYDEIGHVWVDPTKQIDILELFEQHIRTKITVSSFFSNFPTRQVVLGGIATGTLLLNFAGTAAAKMMTMAGLREKEIQEGIQEELLKKENLAKMGIVIAEIEKRLNSLPPQTPVSILPIPVPQKSGPSFLPFSVVGARVKEKAAIAALKVATEKAAATAENAVKFSQEGVALAQQNKQNIVALTKTTQEILFMVRGGAILIGGVGFVTLFSVLWPEIRSRLEKETKEKREERYNRFKHVVAILVTVAAPVVFALKYPGIPGFVWIAFGIFTDLLSSRQRKLAKEEEVANSEGLRFELIFLAFLWAAITFLHLVRFVNPTLFQVWVEKIQLMQHLLVEFVKRKFQSIVIQGWKQRMCKTVCPPPDCPTPENPMTSWWRHATTTHLPDAKLAPWNGELNK